MRVTSWAFAFIGFLIFTVSAEAISNVSLTWDPSTEPAVAGYKIYYGGSSGNYTNSVTVGNVTSFSVPGLTAGATYYFAATTYDSAGDESDFSNEISYNVGETATLTLVSHSANQFSFLVSGVPGNQYVVQASTNLIDWIPLQTNMSPITFIDSDAGRFNHRFYRSFLLSP